MSETLPPVVRYTIFILYVTCETGPQYRELLLLYLYTVIKWPLVFSFT